MWLRKAGPSRSSLQRSGPGRGEGAAGAARDIIASRRGMRRTWVRATARAVAAREPRRGGRARSEAKRETVAGTTSITLGGVPAERIAENLAFINWTVLTGLAIGS